MGASECFTLPADRLSKYCLLTKIATRHYSNICVEQHFALPSHELSLEHVTLYKNSTLRGSTQPTGMYVTSLSPERYMWALIFKYFLLQLQKWSLHEAIVEFSLTVFYIFGVTVTFISLTTFFSHLARYRTPSRVLGFSDGKSTNADIFLLAFRTVSRSDCL